MWKGLHDEFGWFIYGLLGLGFLWFFSGGAEREIAKAGVYLKPLAPIDSGRAYGGSYLTERSGGSSSTLKLPTAPADVVRTAEEKLSNFFEEAEAVAKIHGVSLLSKRVALDGVAGAQISAPHREYIRIVLPYDAESSRTLTGLSVKSGSSGETVAIPDGTELPILGIPYNKSTITLAPGGRAIVSTGRSPIGTSFRINKCTGYLGQFQEYVPELRKDCPYPIDELKLVGPYEESSCRDFVSSLPRCATPRTTLPSTLSAACRSFIVEKLTYNSCALRHEGDADFYSREWRVFLGRTTELWKDKQEIMRLLDEKGVTLDALTY